VVVHTAEDTPVGDGDPICELARGEREIGEEREGRERGKRGRRDRNEHFADKKSIRLFDSFIAATHIRLALRPTDGHAFMQTRSALAAVPSTRRS
jgi:hypothetical protein